MKLLSTILLVVALLIGCSSTTTTPRSCEQRFQDALLNGVNYTQALGGLTECLRLRGDVVGYGIR
jgi:uncharacterized protein YcfL